MNIPFEADDEYSGDFWVEGARMTCFLDSEYAFDPGDDLMGARVGWLIEVDDAVLE